MISRLSVCLVSLHVLSLSAPRLLAQDPSLAPADLKFTKTFAAKNHLLAFVKLETAANKYERYQYDAYSDVERIKVTDGTTYARPQGKGWLRSDDWGKTGTPVNADKARELDSSAQIALLPFTRPEFLDKTQGVSVWKFIRKTQDKTAEYFTYERTRERPRPGGEYPTYTFMKLKGDADGKLLLSGATGQLRFGQQRVPYEMTYDVLVPLPPGTKFEVVHNKPPKRR